MESWFDPVLNVTAMIGGNASAALKNCFSFGYSVYEVGYTTVVDDYEYAIGSYLMAFLFN